MSARLSRGARWGAGGFLGCVGVATFALVAGAQSPPPPKNTAGEKVFLAGIPVAGKSQEEVRKIAAEYAARLLETPVRVRHGKRRERVTPEKLGATVDVKGAVSAVFGTGETDNLLDRIRDRFGGPEPRDVPLPVRLGEAGVAKALRRFSLRIGIAPKEARLTKIGGAFKKYPPAAGTALDSASAARAVQAALDAPTFRTGIAESLEKQPQRAEWLKAQEPIEITAETRAAPPRITLDDLKEISATLSTFGTGLGGTRNRVHNITLAVGAIDGTVLLPGDVFSYNDTVGPRVPSAGYREAPVIIKGELQPGTGGGICQVSSTLYNAALLADMEIVRRSHHAFPVHYLPAGRDATVTDGGLDLQFKNRLEHPVALDAKVTGGRVVFNIYGHPDDDREVRILSSEVSRVSAKSRTVSDPALPKGRRVVEKRAKSGVRVTITRVVKKHGEVLRREAVSHDYYHPFAGVTRVGTAEIARKTEKPVSPEAAAESEKHAARREGESRPEGSARRGGTVRREGNTRRAATARRRGRARGEGIIPREGAARRERGEERG
jgi:vancomycin resistance protein YoaR